MVHTQIHEPRQNGGNLEVTAQGQVCYTSVTTAGVLLVHSTKFGGSGGLLGHDCSSNGGDLLFTVIGIPQKCRTPRVSADSAPSNEDRCGCKLTWEVMKQIVALEGAIQNVTRKLDDALVGMSGFKVTNQECMGGGDGDVVLESFQDLLFHRNNLGRNTKGEASYVRERDRFDSHWPIGFECVFLPRL